MEVVMPRINTLKGFEKLLEYKEVEYVDEYGQNKTQKRYNWQDNKDLVKWLNEKKYQNDKNRSVINKNYVNSKIEDVIIWQPNAPRKIKDYIATLKTFIKRDLERNK